jgi:hypothetical protein
MGCGCKNKKKPEGEIVKETTLVDGVEVVVNQHEESATVVENETSEEKTGGVIVTK